MQEQIAMKIFYTLNDETNNLVAFSCDTNLTFLRQVKTIFVDKTFKVRPELFYKFLQFML